MAAPIKPITPPDRIGKWGPLWAKPKLLDSAATEAAYEEFVEGFVPSRMHNLFLRTFGVKKAIFGNRFFMEDAIYHDWNVKLSDLGAEEPLDVIAIYALGEELEGYQLRGQSRRSLRDIVIDDWHASCAIVRSGETRLFVFVEPKMRGCIVRSA